MKSKSLPLLIFGVLALSVLMNFASATVTFSAPQFVSTSNNTFTVTATSNVTGSDTETITSLTSIITDALGNAYSLTPTGNLSFTALHLTENLVYTIPSGDNIIFQSTNKLASLNITSTGTNVISGIPGSISPSLVDASFPNQPQQASSCQLIGNPSNHLSVDVDSIKVVNGYGSDSYWYPLDNLEAKVIVTNNGPETIKNIAVKWILYDTTTKKKIMSDSQDTFSLKSDADKTVTIDFQLPGNLNDDNYVFYAWVAGNDEAYDGNPQICATGNSDGASVNIDSHFVVLDSLTIPDSVSCGGTAQITGTAWNIGSEDESNVYLIVYSSQLGINQRVNIGDISSGDNKDFSFTLNVPNDVPVGTYSLTLNPYDNSNDIFKNENGDKSTSQLILNVNQSCSTVPQVSVAANLQSQAKSGQELDVLATFVNTGSKSTTYTLDLTDYSDWASLISMDKNSVTLNAGDSQNVLIKLKVNDGISGSQKLTLNVKDGNKVLAQPISVSVEKGFSFPNLTGFITGLGGDNWYLWGIGALNLILVVIIIAVALRVVKKNKKRSE